MKKIIILMLLVSGFLLVFEQSKFKPNLYIICIAFVLFMFSLMKLSFKIPSKNNNKKDHDI